MQNEQVYSKLTGIFHDVFDDDELVLRPDLTAEDVPEWNSLSHTRLVLTIQQKFLAAWTLLFDRALSTDWVGRRVLLSRYTRTMWNAALVVVVSAVILLLNSSAPPIVYKSF